jgi:hypothetical protein
MNGQPYDGNHIARTYENATGEVTQTYPSYVVSLLRAYRPGVFLVPDGDGHWEVRSKTRTRQPTYIPGPTTYDTEMVQHNGQIYLDRTQTRKDAIVPYLTVTGYRAKGVAPRPRETVKTAQWVVPRSLVDALRSRARTGLNSLANLGIIDLPIEKRRKVNVTRRGMLACWLLSQHRQASLNFETWKALLVKSGKGKEPARSTFSRCLKNTGAIKIGTCLGLSVWHVPGSQPKGKPVVRSRPLLVKPGDTVIPGLKPSASLLRMARTKKHQGPWPKHVPNVTKPVTIRSLGF